MVKKIFPRISAHIFVDTFFNYLLDPDSRRLRLHSSGGISREIQDKLAVMTVDQAFCCSNLEAEPVVLSSVHQSKDPNLAFARELGLRAYVCNPLRVGHKLIGTLAFASRTRDRFTEDEVEFTRIVAQYVAIAIDRARNESALRRAQFELSRHTESLEEKVQERTGKLQETIAELESFSYSLAHDVRAPLRHIQGFSQTLIEDHGEELSAEARRYVQFIHRAIKRLDRLTRDILEYSKVASKPVKLAPVNLDRLVREILAHNEGLNTPGVVRVNAHLHPVMGEPSLLHQCVANLLENALKFIPPEVAPRITLWTEVITASERQEGQVPKDKSARPSMHPVQASAGPGESASDNPNGPRPGRWVRLWVEDNGIGISPEYHGKIFGIFERLSHNYEGTGIGLAIASKSVHRMGGRLGVESEVGSGSRFWVELPAAD